ncbi:hypothetical protein M433DRAFT_167131 [Acidomyces richmondensis BFW]|nr:hypothetical protein M433DRAFT_167131 [Acidomyces richmondensis BFW]
MKAITPCAILPLAAASGFPPTPEGVKVIHDVLGHPGLSISYKETNICETRAKAWAGYVHMPSTYTPGIQPNESYNISMFFWYFNARNDPENAPTVIYLAGGPGESSMFGVGSDGGPCNILSDSNSTEENQWSLNGHANMLYVDQPVSTGFSYSNEPINSTLDLLFFGSNDISKTGILPFSEYNGSVPMANETFVYGTLPDQSLSKTANTSLNAARTLWYFSQAWFSEFPHKGKGNLGFFGNSYGGIWIPISAAYFQKQNAKIKSGEINGKILEIDTIGYTNGCTDLLYQMDAYPDMAGYVFRDTYGLEILPENVYKEAKNNFTKVGGCRDQIIKCRELGALSDPEQLGINETVNKICLEATLYCAEYVIGTFDMFTDRDDFDVAHFKPDPFPPYYTAGFFNQHWVQKDLGVPVNFTADSAAAQNALIELTGDAVRTEGMKALEYLLASGTKVMLFYGDRDYRCPWLGGERLSLAANWTGADNFRKAGYQNIQVNETYVGGVVRQHGQLAFARIFESGHDLAAYQPQTTYEIFNRALFNTDIATGVQSTSGCFRNYTTHGPSSCLHIKKDLPPPPPTECYVYNAFSSCSEEQFKALTFGNATIENFTVVIPVGDHM